MKRRYDFAVVGGGITGLAAAFYLRQRMPNKTVVVLEASRYWGGKIITERLPGTVIEWGPDSILTSKPDALALARSLGLDPEICPVESANQATLVYRNGRLIPMPKDLFLLAPRKSMGFLKSPLFSIGGKLRILAERCVPRRRDLEDESIAAFVRRRFGEEALQVLGGPLLAGIYMGDPETLSMRSAFPLLVEMERKAGSVIAALAAQAQPPTAGRNPFVSFRTGMQALPDALVSRLDADLCSGCEVRSIQTARDGYRLATTGGECTARQVVVTIDPQGAHRLFASVCPLPQLKEMSSLSSVVVNLLFGPDAAPPAALGLIVPRAQGREVRAVSFSSRKFAGRAPEGHSLLRAFLGGHGREEVVDWTDEAIEACVLAELQDLCGIRGAPRMVRIVRWRSANPQYAVGHSKRMDSMREVLRQASGLSLIGSAYGGVGVPDCIAQARKLVEGLESAP